VTPIDRRLALASVAAVACAAPPDAHADRAAAQLAAATRLAVDVARNPGPLEAFCVAYSGDWEDPPLPTVGGSLTFAYADGCEEIDGQLFARGGSARAIWIGVAEPEGLGPAGGRVPVFTSTGLDDAASYLCELVKTGSTWIAESCRAGPVG